MKKWQSQNIEKLAFIFAAFQSLVYIGCAIWLNLTAKANRSSQWLWTFLGLFSGIFAIILWFLWQIRISLDKQEEKI